MTFSTFLISLQVAYVVLLLAAGCSQLILGRWKLRFNPLFEGLTSFGFLKKIFSHGHNLHI